MIIISETKKEHYLIKQFLTETYDPTRFYASTNLKPVEPNDMQDTVVDQPVFVSTAELDIDNEDDKTLINKIIQSKPKYSRIKNLVKQGLITLTAAASLYAASQIKNNQEEQANHERAAVQKIENHIKEKNIPSINIEKVKKELNINSDSSVVSNQNNSVQKIDTPTANKTQKDNPVNKKLNTKNDLLEKSIERIKKFERFKPFPYQDEGGVSVGYGTQFITKGKASDVDSNWKDIIYNKLGYTKDKIEKLKKDKSYKEKTEKELNKYISKIETRIDQLEKRKDRKVKGSKKFHFPKAERERLKKSIENIQTRIDAANDRGIILLDEALQCLEIDINEALSKAEKDFGKAFDKMDENLQIIFVDMYYNLGLYFLKVHYKDFNKNLKNYAEELVKEKPDTKTLISHLELALKEISPLEAPKYYRQNKKRATENYNLFKKAIKNLKNSLKENKSLKSVYGNLFS